MIAIFEFGLKYYKNRRRFDDIISDKRYPYIKSIFNRLILQDKELKDIEILSEYKKFSDAQQSNTYAIAQLELAVVSVLCSSRPHLSEQLLERSFLSIIYSLGEEIGEDHVIRFINDYILKRNSEPYGGLPPKSGLIWIKGLRANRVLIKTVLTKMVEFNKEDDRI